MKTADVNKSSSCQCNSEMMVCGCSAPAAFAAQCGTNILLICTTGCSSVGSCKRRELPPGNLPFLELGAQVQTHEISFSKLFWLNARCCKRGFAPREMKNLRPCSVDLMLLRKNDMRFMYSVTTSQGCSIMQQSTTEKSATSYACWLCLLLSAQPNTGAELSFALLPYSCYFLIEFTQLALAN